MKNTDIRLLLEQEIDIEILVDDDVLFHQGWLDAYLSLNKGSTTTSPCLE